VPPSSHLTPCIPTKSNLDFDSFLETVIKEPALYKLLTFNNPNLISIFRRLSCLSKESVQVRRLYFVFRNKFIFYGEGLLAPRPTPKLSFVRGCLFNTFAATLHSWRPFLHPQPENASCCGDRDLPNMAYKHFFPKMEL
jgi:hypothetical protein